MCMSCQGNDEQLINQIDPLSLVLDNWIDPSVDLMRIYIMNESGNQWLIHVHFSIHTWPKATKFHNLDGLSLYQGLYFRDWLNEGLGKCWFSLSWQRYKSEQPIFFFWPRVSKMRSPISICIMSRHQFKTQELADTCWLSWYDRICGWVPTQVQSSLPTIL